MTGTGTTSTAGGDLGKQAVSIARKYLGVDYKWGGNDPETGLDCSGLTKLVYGQLGVDLPRVSRDQAKVGTKVDSLKEAKPGDLVFFDDPVDHVGIYVGNGKMLDAPKTGDKVRIRDVWERPTAHPPGAAGAVRGRGVRRGVGATSVVSARRRQPGRTPTSSPPPGASTASTPPCCRPSRRRRARTTRAP